LNRRVGNILAAGMQMENFWGSNKYLSREENAGRDLNGRAVSGEIGWDEIAWDYGHTDTTDALLLGQLLQVTDHSDKVDCASKDMFRAREH
jgi:hypothetical protein